EGSAGVPRPPSPCALPQPEARVRGLHRVADRAEQLGAQRLEVDLVAQAERERVERARRVVAGAVEATVDGTLDVRADRREDRDRAERRERDRELVPLREGTQDRLQRDDRRYVE